MPVASPIDIAVLSSPIPLPRETNTLMPNSFGINTQQNFQAMTKGSGVVSPIGTGNQMTPMPIPSYGSVTGAALESGGANVGGVIQQAPKEDLETRLQFASLEDQKLAGQEEAQKKQVDEFIEAYEEGTDTKRTELIDEGVEKSKQLYDSLSDKNKQRLDKIGLDSKKVESTLEKVGDLLSGGKKTGMSGARTAKRKDRRDDRKARKEAGLKGSKKRQMRKAQRKARRAAFKDFKAERDYQASLDAAIL